jgi:hypothetical protein
MGSIKQFFHDGNVFYSLSKYKMNENYSLSATLHLEHVYLKNQY